MADQENYDNNEELMNEQEFMGDNNGDSNNQDDDHNGTNGGAENAGRDDDRWATLARISTPRFDWQEKTINTHPRVFPTSFWFWKLFSLRSTRWISPSRLSVRKFALKFDTIPS